jgi:hypothetical protein
MHLQYRQMGTERRNVNGVKLRVQQFFFLLFLKKEEWVPSLLDEMRYPMQMTFGFLGQLSVIVWVWFASWSWS